MSKTRQREMKSAQACKKVDESQSTRMSRTVLTLIAGTLCRRVHFLPNLCGGCKWIAPNVAFPKPDYCPTCTL